MPPEIKTTPGNLPRFWDRSVLFFCNMHSIFYDNQEETDDLLSQIYGAHSYGSRVVSILNLLFHRGPNKILLEAAPEPNLLDYLSGDLRLSLPSFDVLDHRGYQDLVSTLQAKGSSEIDPSVEALRNHPASWVDGFVTDRILVQVATRLQKRTISTFEGSKNGNNKYLLYLHQVEQGLPVFETFLAANPAEVPSCLDRLNALGYRKAVIKAQIGASGYGMVKVETRVSRPQAMPDYLFFEGPCMVQGWLDQETKGVDTIGSPSIQMFLNDDTVFMFDWTEQILSAESVHEGNMSPPPYIPRYPELAQELFRQGAIAGEWLHAQGYRGTASTDFLVIGKEGRAQVIICEINARVTGATYPSLLARQFMPDGCWSMRNIQFRKSVDGDQLLSLMDRAAVLYRPGKDNGIIPFNFNTDNEGKVIKGQFLCLGENHETCNRLLAKAWTELPVEWGYDRD
ncbi:MAG: hypothetical protein WD688_24835 [Candidatus Binatia bacterium]